MSVIHDNLKRNDGDSDTWFLRINNLIHGPLALEELSNWTEKGKVAAGNEVSHDKKNWFPVESVKSLKMEWLVAQSNGKTFGPLNIAAAPDLIKEGIIESNAMLHNNSTGEQIEASSLLDPGSSKDIMKSNAADLPAPPDLHDHMKDALKDKDSEIIKLKKQLKSTEKEVTIDPSVNDKEMSKLRQDLTNESDAHNETKSRIASLEEQLSKTESSDSKKKDTSTKSEKKLNKEIESLKKQIIDLESGSNQADKVDLSKYEATIRDNQAMLESTKEEFNSLSSEYDSLKKENARLEQETNQDIPPQTNIPGAEWYFKMKNGSIFGPISLFELYDWACECRIGPSHEISSDKKTWYLARNIAELKMEWTVPLIDGTFYGPLNKLAVHHLMNEGAVDASAEIVNYSSGKTIVASSLLTPEVASLQAENEYLRQELSKAKSNKH